MNGVMNANAILTQLSDIECDSEIFKVLFSSRKSEIPISNCNSCWFNFYTSEAYKSKYIGIQNPFLIFSD